MGAMDTTRFNESHYGELETHTPEGEQYPEVRGIAKNKQRALKICREFKDQGCTIEVEDALLGGPMIQRRMKGMNDVAFGHWQGDYGGFVRQTNPEDSKGWWRVGSNSQMFGRFARGFASPDDPSATIGLTFDRGLWGGLPLKSSRNLKLRLIFFDGSKGTFSIHYDSQKGPKILSKVAKKGSGMWRELCQDLPHARFGGSGPHSADLWLTNDDKDNDIFDSLEVTESINALQNCDWSQDVAFVV